MTDLQTRIKRLELLCSLVVPCPAEWLAGGASGKAAAVRTGSGMEMTPCASYAAVRNAWRKAVKWFEGADHTLAVMFACSFSTEFVGEQLWFKIIGPPSSLKTTLLEGLAVCDEYIFSKDSLRGFHDGWKDDEGEDKSLIALARGKTLAIKDGDTLLKAPDLPRILSEARALYDRVSRTHYRNHKIVDYVGHRMSWLLCGTSALRDIDDSELGARFLDCVMMERIDEEFEDEVGLSAVHQEDRNMRRLSDGKPESQHPPELVAAMSLTGGYVKFLRDNAHALSNEVRLGDQALEQIPRLGKFIAFMRCRPPKKGQDELSDREFSARLNKQLVRLARSLTVVLNKPETDADVMSRVRQIAFDTARGDTLEIARHLHKMGPAGSTVGGVSVAVNKTEDAAKKLLRFLKHHGIVDNFIKKLGAYNHQTRWVLTTKFRHLWEKVVGNAVGS